MSQELSSPPANQAHHKHFNLFGLFGRQTSLEERIKINRAFGWDYGDKVDNVARTRRYSHMDEHPSTSAQQQPPPVESPEKDSEKKDQQPKKHRRFSWHHD